MRALSGLRVGPRLITMVLGALTVVAGGFGGCGSISVSNPDGATGSGGITGGGTGGAAGHVGGVGGRTGTGGVTGGGGVTGSGGRLGSGGAMGSGGVNGGSGGVTGAGGAGGADCQQLQRDFVVAFADAKTCVVGATGSCLKQTTDRLDCGCPTFVNQTGTLDLIRQAWARGGCSSGGVCASILCVQVGSALCSSSGTPGQGGVCQDQGIPTPL